MDTAETHHYRRRMRINRRFGKKQFCEIKIQYEFTKENLFFPQVFRNSVVVFHSWAVVYHCSVFWVDFLANILFLQTNRHLARVINIKIVYFRD